MIQIWVSVINEGCGNENDKYFRREFLKVVCQNLLVVDLFVESFEL